MQEVPDLPAQTVDQRGGRLEREADQVDDGIGPEARDPLAERAVPVFLLPVRDDLAYVLPLGRVGIGLPGPAADVDDLVTSAHQPGDEVCADMTAATDDDDSHSSPKT